jgi:hypothetical protein
MISADSSAVRTFSSNAALERSSKISAKESVIFVVVERESV